MASVSRNRVPRLARGDALRWSVGLSVLLTVLFITLLSVRMAAGADPALGPKIARQSRATTTGQSRATTTEDSPVQAPVQAPVQVPLPPATQPQVQVPTAPAPVQPAPVQTTTS